MLQTLRDIAKGLVNWVSDLFAAYLEAIPASTPGTMLPFASSPVETAMDLFVRRITGYLLAAVSTLILMTPWVSPALLMPVGDFMQRAAAYITP
jgi:hypothetical protein